MIDDSGALARLILAVQAQTFSLSSIESVRSFPADSRLKMMQNFST